MNPRTPIEELKLSGSSNLRRALKREAEEKNAQPLSPEQESEIAQLDALIEQALKACTKGQTVKGRRNPAYQNLADLVKTRKLILQGSRPVKEKSAAEVLEEARNLFAKAN